VYVITDAVTESVIPTCFMQTTIVPVSKEAKVTCLNDYRLVALMSVAIKCFEWLVMAHINSILPDTLDPSLRLLTTAVGLITDNDETAYRVEVRELAVWCQDNNLSLNVSKTKELIVDNRKRRAEQANINIDWAVVGERVEFHVPWCPHPQQTIMVQTHQDSCEDITTKPFSPQETEKVWHGSPDPQKVLQLHN
jgi:hypothetical protein